MTEDEVMQTTGRVQLVRQLKDGSLLGYRILVNGNPFELASTYEAARMGFSRAVFAAATTSQ